ncbi:MAG: hypothetical protein HXS50_05970, partial [Theionarchaea archaeon]|nr:hypothetical protein [Theionarchaea archaeon]
TGNGTANYTIDDPWGPPGPFWAEVYFQGEVKDHAKHNGPIVIDGIYTGVTMLEAPNPGYVRTESVNGAFGYGNLTLPIDPANYIPPVPDGFNVTADLVTVDFSDIGGDGKTFTIRVRGSYTVVPLVDEEEPPVIPELSSLALPAFFTASFALAIHRTRRYRGEPQTTL